MEKITKDITIGELLQKDFGCAAILMGSGMHCVGCPSSQMETLEEACEVHAMNVDQLVDALNEYFAVSEQ